MRMRDGGVTMRSSGPSVKAGLRGPVRTARPPTTSGQLARGAGATGAGAISMGLRGPQAIDAATAINATRYRVRDHLLVFGATSILLKSRSSRAPARRAFTPAHCTNLARGPSCPETGV